MTFSFVHSYLLNISRNQVRVYHGTEFTLVATAQLYLSPYWCSQYRQPILQSFSRQNHRAEWVWMEINQSQLSDQMSAIWDGKWWRSEYAWWSHKVLHFMGNEECIHSSLEFSEDLGSTWGNNKWACSTQPSYYSEFSSINTWTHCTPWQRW